MSSEDLFIVFQWWSVLFLFGIVAYPITKRLFAKWFDQGYLFSKAVGFAVVSYLVYIVGSLKFFPFTLGTIYGCLACCFILGLLPTIITKRTSYRIHWQTIRTSVLANISSWWERMFWQKGIVYFLEELFFFALLLYWTWIKAHEPAIRGLEKFMDYGFMQSIMNARFFPATDMWWAGGSINYYYFGHLVTAVLTKVSGLSLGYTFNLMLATLFALTASMSFSIGFQLLGTGRRATLPLRTIGGLFTAFLVSLAGNMQTIYAFTKGYTGEDAKPFWQLLWPAGEFFKNLTTGLQTYWYANATRFIPFSIHEFPSYSFVVSDIHGHVLSLPFVLLAIALLIVIFSLNREELKRRDASFWLTTTMYGWLLGVLLMTNALDGPIYGFLFAACWFVFVIWPIRKASKIPWFDLLYPVVLVALLAVASALPFLFFFNSFASGIGVNCPPAAFAESKVGPLLFETVDKCQRSPLWMMWLLWGFFWFTGVWLFIKKIWRKDDQDVPFIRILKVFFLFSIGLIIFPEFLYIKDIYPMHFRSNTMFKLGYQAYIMWSIIAGFVIIHIISSLEARKQKLLRTLFLVLLVPQLFLVSIYPLFSVRSYFGSLETYRGIWGLSWIENEFTPYWDAITWLKTQLPSNGPLPVIVEAAGDSYTDNNLVSAFTGLPSITGWAVHEWLWRGSYDIVAPRQESVRTIYESTDVQEISSVLDAYHVRYVIRGPQEQEKYKIPPDQPLDQLGARVFTSGDLVIWDVGKR